MTPHMTRSKLLSASLLFVAVLLALNPAGAGSQSAPSTVPVTTVVTVLGPKFTAPPPVGKDDVIVHVKDKREDVKSWNSAQGDRAALYLAILIDDGANIGPRLGELRKFVQDQPNSTSVGVFYASSGLTRTAAEFSTDHNAVAQKVRITLGRSSVAVSIYLAVIDVMNKLQGVTGRREILLISDGHDRLRGDLQSPDVDRVVSYSQQSGIVIHTLYTSVPGRRNSFSQSLAQGNLINVASASGGQSFFQGLSTPVSYSPFLNQLDMVLHNQYLLTFTTPVSSKKKGEFRKLKVTTEQTNTSITVQSDVFVPGPLK